MDHEKRSRAPNRRSCQSERSTKASEASHRAKSKNPYTRDKTRKETIPKNSNAAHRASHPMDRIVRVFLLSPLSPRRRRHDRFSPSAHSLSRTRSRICRSQLPILQSCDYQSATVAVASSPVSLRRAKLGRRPQRPGNQSRLRASSGCFPRRSALVNHRLPLALPQSSGRVRNPHVSLNPLSVTLSLPATQKTSAIVQKLWTLRLPCGSRRKSKTELLAQIGFSITYTPSRFCASLATDHVATDAFVRPAKGKPSGPDHDSVSAGPDHDARVQFHPRRELYATYSKQDESLNSPQTPS